jgi:guanylate kinase
LNKRGRLIVITGPSGVGKTTLIKKLLKNYKNDIFFSISYTSRLPRKSEVNGIDYFFISKNEFEKRIKKNRYLEYALVHDNYYGTDKKFIDDIILSGKDCLLDIDVQGGLNLMSKKIDAIYIFIAPPSITSLKERLLKRYTDTIEVIEKRVNNAKKELKEKDNYQYIIINDNIDRAYKELETIIFNI